MSNTPQQPYDETNRSRPMPPDYGQASGSQQPYGQQPGGSQPNRPGSPAGSQPSYGSQPQSHRSEQYGSQPGPGSQPEDGSQQSLGSPGYGGQPGYGSQPAYGSRPGEAGGPGYGFGGPANPALFDSRALGETAYGPGSERFWNANESERTTALWTNVGALFAGFLPLIMFLVKKDESPFVREYARQGTNAWITNMIITTAALIVFGIIGGILVVFTFGLSMLLMYVAFVVPLVYAVIYIIAAVAANKGEGYKFPLTINFIK